METINKQVNIRKCQIISVLIKIKQDEMIVTASSSGVTFKVRPDYREGMDTKDLERERVPDRTASWRAQDENKLGVFEGKEEVYFEQE